MPETKNINRSVHLVRSKSKIREGSPSRIRKTVGESMK